MKVGDQIKFDYMGKEHCGTIVEIISRDIGSRSHDIVREKSDKHNSDPVINNTLTAEGVGENERA